MENRSERITYDDVANICNLLISVEVEPTILKVHSILDRGSNSTIAKYLQQWKEEESNRGITLSIKIIRYLESEIENEALKISKKARSENVLLSNKIKILEDDLEIANAKLDSFEVQINNQKKESQEKISKLISQIEAEKLEKNLYRRKSENFETENKDIFSKTIAIETKYNLSLENEKKLEVKIAKLENDKEKLLIQIGDLKSLIGSKKNI